eukprot:SM000029S10499  [mRNA]  locus=s29:440833:443559:- [translate_table: standard]
MAAGSRLATSHGEAAEPPLPPSLLPPVPPSPAWLAAGRGPEEALAFIAEHFDEAGSDLLPHAAPDFALAPPPERFLPLLPPSGAARTWALAVHGLWPALLRAVAPAVAAQPGRHSLLPLPHAIVVPGERFREAYYWDSYWIVRCSLAFAEATPVGGGRRGLLASGMAETARGVVLNLLSLCRCYGFVPNGGRTYYLSRSQPPLLSAAVRAVYEAAGDLALLRTALPTLAEEHAFWTRDPHAVTVRDARRRTHSLSRYYAAWEQPRPESYLEDVAAAEGLAPAEAAALYREIASTAESGWDFSSRWMEYALPPLPPDRARIIFLVKSRAEILTVGFFMSVHILMTCIAKAPCRRTVVDQGAGGGSSAVEGAGAAAVGARQLGERSPRVLRRLRTTLIVPADLNGYLLQMEANLAHFATLVGDEARGIAFAEAARVRRRAIEALLWSDADGQWRDLWLPRPPMQAADNSRWMATSRRTDVGCVWDGGTHNGAALASNFVPLWCGAFSPGDRRVSAVVSALEQSGLLQPAGIAATMEHTGEQWDFPNAWAPLQHMLAEGLAATCTPRGLVLGADLAGRWLRSVAEAHAAGGGNDALHEKYDARRSGIAGDGGEYAPQVGFGWTNGTALALMATFGWPDGNGGCDVKQQP